MTLDLYDHIEESDRLRYVDGELDDAGVAAVEQHVADCTACRDAVDDLAAASDGLTAFLNQADFQPRALTYHGVLAGNWWSNPWAIAAVLVLFLGGVVAPATLFRARWAGTVAPAVVPSVQGGPVARGVGRAAESQPVVVLPDDESVAVISSGEAVVVIPTSDVFAIEVNSWQAGGSLKLIFEDTDVFSYRTVDGGRTTSTINTQRGLMQINTTADSEANHEVRIPVGRMRQVIVRVAGQVIPFAPTPAPGRTATINLRFPAR